MGIQEKEQISVGIDFGTTNSLIAFSQNQRPVIIPNEQSLELIPSIIGFYEGEFIIGDIAHHHVALLHSIKRLFGKKLSDLQSNPALFSLSEDHIDLNSEILRIKFDGKSLTVPEVAAQIFLYLKKQACRRLGPHINVTKAVITVPAHFNDAARGEVILAAKIAGFEVLRLIAEPTAAAYAYGLHKKSTGCYVVYDLGGGTFDVSILNMQTGILQVIATAGDNMLGGDDIDHLVVRYFCDIYKIRECKELKQFAKKAKEMLTIQEKFCGMFAGKMLELNLEDFEQLILPLVQRTIDITQDTLIQAGNRNISGIIMVGGSTRIPLIKRKLEQTFNTTIFSDIDPDKAVVWGAALQAENLTSANINSLLIDVVPLSLGIELNGGITEKLIRRNTPIPISVSKEFTNYVDNQRFMKLHIVQGEREMVEDCRSLAKFELELPLMKAGLVRTEVTFSIDVDGILSVTAFEKNSGVSHIISVKPSYGLSEEEINEILENAYKNVAADRNNKLLQETVLDAQTLIYNVENIIDKIENVLIQEDEIREAISTLREAVETNKRNYIIECRKKLERIIEPLMTNRLNEVIGSLLKGKHIEDV